MISEQQMVAHLNNCNVERGGRKRKPGHRKMILAMESAEKIADVAYLGRRCANGPRKQQAKQKEEPCVAHADTWAGRAA